MMKCIDLKLTNGTMLTIPTSRSELASNEWSTLYNFFITPPAIFGMVVNQFSCLEYNKYGQCG